MTSTPPDETAIKIINGMEQDEKRTLLSALRKFIQKIKTFISKYTKTTVETRAFIGDTENISKLAEMVRDSIVNTDIRYSLEEPGEYTAEDFDEVYNEDGDLDFLDAVHGELSEWQRTRLEGEIAELDSIFIIQNIYYDKKA